MQVETTLKEILEKAWKVRKVFFPDTVEFALPNNTLAVSVTGTECELHCAHCNGAYLKQMTPLKKALESRDNHVLSYLVSGGCNAQGKVPLLEHWAELKKLAARGRLNLHTGLVGVEEVQRLGAIADVVSFDFVGDNDTIANVYGIKATVDDYLTAYRTLNRYVRVIPHICIGLDGGRIKGEYKILETLKYEAVEAISMIVFRPTAGTAFSDCQPPSLDEVALFIATARLMFPRTPLYLGCMRPGGRYREKLDLLALEAGINKIVLPAPAARHRAEQLGLIVTGTGECCSL